MAADTAQPQPTLPGPSIKGLAVRSVGKAGVTINAIAESESGLVVEKAEWWVSNDPGHGNGNPMKAIGDVFESSRVDITASIDVSQFKEGEHGLNVRSADVRGVWGDPQTITFAVRKKKEVNPPDEKLVKEPKTVDINGGVQPLKKKPDTKEPETLQETKPTSTKPHTMLSLIHISEPTRPY